MMDRYAMGSMLVLWFCVGINECSDPSGVGEQDHWSSIGRTPVNSDRVPGRAARLVAGRPDMRVRIPPRKDGRDAHPDAIHAGGMPATIHAPEGAGGRYEREDRKEATQGTNRADGVATGGREGRRHGSPTTGNPGYRGAKQVIHELTESRLTQMLLGESGAHYWDWSPMLLSIRNLSRGGNLVETMRVHIPKMKTGPWVQLSKPWLTHVDSSCDTPQFWLMSRPWQGIRQSTCLRVVGLVRRFLQGRMANPCRGGQPDQWRKKGIPRLRKHMRRLGAKRIGCGPKTKHSYWQLRRKGES